MPVIANGKYRVIEFLLDSALTGIKVTAVAKALGVSKGYVSTVLKQLRKEGVMADGGIDLSNPNVRAMKILFNIRRLTSKGVIGRLQKAGVTGAGIYGSWAAGTNTAESDIDIWVKPKKAIKQIDIARAQRDIGDALGIEPQIIVVSPERVAQLKKDNITFYYSLMFGSIRLFGEGIE